MLAWIAWKIAGPDLPFLAPGLKTQRSSAFFLCALCALRGELLDLVRTLSFGTIDIDFPVFVIPLTTSTAPIVGSR